MKEYRFEITLPEKVVNFLGLPKKELEKGLKRELAIHFFQSEVLQLRAGKRVVWYVCLGFY